MALKETTAFFLLGVMAIQVYCANAANSSCDILNATNVNNNSSNYVLNVNPTTISANETYTVTVTGSGNVTIILQALQNNINVGNWSSGNESCSGSPLFIDQLQNTSVNAKWSSPDTVGEVVISAHISNGSDVFLYQKTLTSIGTTVSPSNWTTSNTNTTKAPGTSLPQQNTTAITVAQTTNTGTAKHHSSMFLALIQTVGLLFISSKILS
ncbi:uncharacterized protein O3C94_014884 [Discoglossus pictus]